MESNEKVEGTVRKMKGEIKETAVKHINNPHLEPEGKEVKIAGKEDLPNEHILMSGKQKAKTIR